MRWNGGGRPLSRDQALGYERLQRQERKSLVTGAR